MGKHDPFSPKAIANRMKAKGLQKLRWYCQLCQKQCRDENGFKCHMTSEGHLRQMRLFGEDPNKVINEYSQQVRRISPPPFRLHASLRLLFAIAVGGVSA